MRRIRPFLVTTALLAVGLPATASPQTDSEADAPAAAPARPLRPAPVAYLDLADFRRRADLVFRGDVVDISYALSEPAAPGQVPLPHTFVSYAVRSVLAGTAPGPVVTLRFIGGYDPVQGRVLHASIVPRFDVGDSDVLFVQGNGRRMSPLVENASGRLRIVDGRTYTETGRAVTVGADGMLQIGQRSDLEDVRTTFLPTGVHRTQVGPDVVQGPGDAAPVEEILARIAALPAPPQGPSTAFVDADPFLAFSGPDLAPAPPPAAGPDEEDR